MALRIIIADDHPVTRTGVKQLVTTQGLGQVVAEADSPNELMQALGSHPCDLVITGCFLMADQEAANGLAVIQTIRSRFPTLPLLLLVGASGKGVLRTAVRLGVLGLLDLESSAEGLPEAIQAVQGGHAYVSPTLKDDLEEGDTSSPDGAAPLSPREQEVLRLIGTGMTVQEIALQLHLSVRTISRMKDNGMKKLGLKSDAELPSSLRDGKP